MLINKAYREGYSDRLKPPLMVWMAAIIVIILRGIPFFRIIVNSANHATQSVYASYIPQDWLQYVAFIRQSHSPNGLFLANPFTTDPQGQRFILLFHQLLNYIYHITGIDPFWLLELSRIPLLLLFFYVLWRFTRNILSSNRESICAVWLVALSGGFDYLARFAVVWFPFTVRDVVAVQLHPLIGWSTFGSLWNPLWVAGFTLLLLVLGRVLKPGGPVGWRDYFVISFGFFLLWFTHPYSGIAAMAAIIGAFFFSWAAGSIIDYRWISRVLLTLLPSIGVIGAITTWQRNDPIFRISSGSIIGEQATAVFWYPLTLGILFFFVLRACRIWAIEARPWLFKLVGWSIAIALLHSSPILNGAHFVSYLHLPLCILSAPLVSNIFDKCTKVRISSRIAIVLWFFLSPIANTYEAWKDAESLQIPSEYSDVFYRINNLPGGNVLSPANLGNLIPAYGPHRVFVGHWFLTPDYSERSQVYERVIRDPDHTVIRNLVINQHIDYIVVPTIVASNMSITFSDLNAVVYYCGNWAIVRLRWENNIY